ncbi:MAG: hypothetical protein HRU14_00300 [Planctomycetes bacterium]|nr:hypothetical protein [Planctomycetota bacterium]
MIDATADLARMVNAVLERPPSGEEAPGMIDSAAPYRVLAWPDYRSDGELRDLIRDYAHQLAGRGDVSLCLLQVPGVDPRLEDAIEATARAWSQVVGSSTADCLHFIDDAPGAASWAALGRSAHAVVSLDSSRDCDMRRSFKEAVGVRVVERPAQLQPLLNGLRGVDRATDTRMPWVALGYETWLFDGATVVDFAPGPRLRTQFFDGAVVEVIEPRASTFAEHCRWSDLDRAHRVWTGPPSERITAIGRRACLVVVGDALESADDPARALATAASYLAPGGELVVKKTRALESLLPSVGLRTVRSTAGFTVLT